MDSRHGKARMNVESDRLSKLPDDLIHKILSLVDIKLVVQTSALSSRWRFTWTSMPYLNFSTEDFFTLPKFSKFVTHLLSHRNNIDVFSVKLRFRGKISTNGFHALEKADVDVFSSPAEKVHHIVHLLQQLHNVRFLTLNFHIVELLALFVELFSNLPSPFTNLKRLKIYPQYPDEEVTLCTEVKNYLLDSSPSATLILVSHEEIKAQDLMKQLQVLLKECKENSETNTAYMEQPTAKMQCHFGGRMTEIEGYWEDLNVQFGKGKKKTQRVISMLREIEKLLTKVHMPQRAKMQTQFYSLCAEADIIMTNMIHCMKMQFDKKPTPPHATFMNLLQHHNRLLS